jgi:hypothetical protein
MPAGRVSLGLPMRLTGILAPDLAVVRDDLWLFRSPIFVRTLVALEIVLSRASILGRLLGAFCYTFLVACPIPTLARFRAKWFPVGSSVRARRPWAD